MASTIGPTLDHIKRLAQHVAPCGLRGQAIVMLMELGIPTNCFGFEYLLQAILLRYKDPTRQLANDIYLVITERCNLNSEEQVSQAIRDVLKSAWRNGSKAAWDWYFAYDKRPLRKRPANNEFISKIAYLLELWQECREKEGSYDR